MNTTVSSQKKRPENTAGSAWLRGGQTIAHTLDMILELWNKLKWILLIWAAVCWVIADQAAADGDQLYAGLKLVAWFYTVIGSPLPDSLNVPGPDGLSYVVEARHYDSVPFIHEASSRYFGYMWKGAWLWLAGAVCMICGLSFAFIKSGDAKLESHDIRGQQIVNLRTLVALIRRYNLAKARELNREGLASIGIEVPAKESMLVQSLSTAVPAVSGWFRDIMADIKGEGGSAQAPGVRHVHDPVVHAGSFKQLQAHPGAAYRIVNDPRWEEGGLQQRDYTLLSAAAFEAKAKGMPFFVTPADFKQPIIAGVPYPYKAEYEHTLVVGGTGSGKSVAIHALIDSIKARGDCAIVYDPEGEFIRAHYREGIDRIFNPFDVRSVDWSPYMDLNDLTHWQSSAADLFPDPKTGDPYWTLATRTIYSYAGWLLGTTMRAHKKRNPTIGEFLDLLVGPHEKLYAHLKNTPAGNTLGEKAGPRSDSLRSVLITGAERLSHLLGTKENFSIREWINDPAQKGFLFLSAPEDLAATIKPILAHLSSLTITALLSRDAAQSKKTTWIILDEFTSLGKMDSLADSPARLRKFGGCMVIGMQQVSQIEEIYGEPKARSIVGQLRNKLILACNDPRTGEFMSDLIGKREVRRIEETTSYGANNIRDGVGLAPKDSVEPIAMAEQIQRLATRTGYIMFSPGQQGTSFPVSLVTYPFVPRPERAASFIPHNRRNPIEIHYLKRLGVRDDALGGIMAPGPEGLSAETASHNVMDKEAVRDDVSDLAPVESEAVRSAPHQSIVEDGSVSALVPADAEPGATKPGQDMTEHAAILDSLNDLFNGPSHGI